MAINKNFKLKADQIVQLIEPMGGCIATDKITISGELVDYMYRDEPNYDLDKSRNNKVGIHHGNVWVMHL